MPARSLRSAVSLQEPVNELKKEYMGVIDSLAPVLGEEGIQQVCLMM